MPIASDDGNIYESEYHQLTGQPMPAEAPTKITVTKEQPVAEPTVPGTLSEDFSRLGQRFLDTFTLDKERAPTFSQFKEDLSAGLGHIGNALKQGPELMEKVYKGEIDPMSDEGIKAVNEVAMNFGIAGLVTAPLKPGVGMFGGRMSTMARHQAEKMEAEGFHPITIKETTGLERGAEGAWRREFSDADSVFNPGSFQESSLREIKDLRLPMVLKHDKLFEVYPETKNIHVVLDDSLGTTWGRFSPSKNTIHLNPSLLKNPEKAREIILHEVQHWVQYVEDFNYGVLGQIPQQMQDRFKGFVIKKFHEKEVRDVIKLVGEGRTEEAKSLAQNVLDHADYKTYRAISSEVEAFNVQRRSRMTEAQLAKTLATHTEDVPRKHQIVIEPEKNQVTLGSKHTAK